MDSEKEKSYQEYKTSRGMQLPLEIFGFRGRYIIWAVIVIALTVISFFAVSVLIGALIALGVAVVILAAGMGYTLFRQKKGQYNKKEDKGVFVFCRLSST